MNRKFLLLVFVLCFSSLFAYGLNRSYNIRFGMPSKAGMLMNKGGFIMLYSSRDKIPLWVSYSLKKKHLKDNVRMVRGYRPDPEVKKKYRAKVSDYAGRGMYDRSRMVPLRDMLRSEEMMKKAHFLSNICPMHHKLNRGPWRALEKKIRRFVREKKEVWIMAGPVFMDLDSDGKRDNYGRLGESGIPVPTHFYKIIVYQANDYSFHAAAFLFPNTGVKREPARCAAPIDKIEKHTGFDFLHLLPDEVEELLERKKPGKKELEYLLDCKE